MLTLFAKHAVMDLRLKCNGDLEVDAHHTVEDCGIALGQAFIEALGDKKGIRRYGSGFHPKNPFTGEAYVPMDECLARCVVDFGGRPHLVWRGLDKFSQKKISESEKKQDASSAFRFGLAREFFQAFANEARCNLHLELLYGDEPHQHRRGALQGLCPRGGCRTHPRFAHCRRIAEHEGEIVDRRKGGGLAGTRTLDQCLKRALLYRLSYQPILL